MRVGDHWLDEEFTAAGFPNLMLQVRGTGPLDRIEFILYGELTETLPQSGQTETELSW